MTRETIETRLKARNPNMEVIEESAFSAQTKIKVKCLKCGAVFNQRTAHEWLYGNAKCYFCDNQSFSQDYESYADYIKRKTNDAIEPLSGYAGTRARMDYRCKLHDAVFTMSHSELFRDHSINPLCPQCKGRKIHRKSYNRDELIRMVNELAPNLEIIGKITAISKEFDYKCRECGHQGKVTISRLQRPRQTEVFCPICNNPIFSPISMVSCVS